MWYRAVRAFVITSLVLNAALAIALVTAMASGLRPPSILDFAACIALLFGFLNAVGDLIEAEGTVITSASAPGDDARSGEPAGPVLHIIRHHGEIGGADATDRETIRLEGLEAFRSER
jgi:hypothetical protein